MSTDHNNPLVVPFAIALAAVLAVYVLSTVL